MSHSPTFRSGLLHPLAALTLLAGLAATGTEPPAAPPKTHTLFMGANLSVVADGATLAVHDVQDNAFVVHGARGRVVVPARDDRFRLKIDDTLKLTTAYATLDRFSFERTYSPENDPMVKFREAARVGSYLAANSDAADAAVRASQSAVGLADAQAAQVPAGAPPEALATTNALRADAATRMAQAEQSYESAQAMNRMDVSTSLAGSNRLNSDLAAEQYDALLIEFDVSSPRPIEHPYVVVIMRYLETKDRPDSAKFWVYAEKLPAIDREPRRIRIHRAGFPPGYHIDSQHLHLYEAGTEIATSMARKQVALTADEAFQYAVIEHLGANRDKTAKPAKAPAFWPDLHGRVPPAQLARTVFVKVGKDGVARGLFEDEKCTRPVADAELAAVAPELRFLPALEKGKAVEGVAAVKLGPAN